MDASRPDDLACAVPHDPRGTPSSPFEEKTVTTAGAVSTRARAAAIPVSETLPWLVSALLVGLVLYYLIGIDEGATSLFGNTTVVHEFVHDARHFLGFPCH